jgi:hypothetical protein
MARWFWHGGGFDDLLYVTRASDAASVVLSFPARRAFSTFTAGWWR